jgi:hypothetical protein
MGKLYLILLLGCLTACAPISQTAANVSNFVAGTQVVSYAAPSETVATTIQDITPTMPLYSGYTPLRVGDISTTQGKTRSLVVSAQALKGSVSSTVNAEDFSLEFSLVENVASTELTVRPSSASNDTAREVVTDYIKRLDEILARFE